ncbi:MAG: GAF domain-containing protein, partial [Dehalococcoidia bacterium]|nr:GAF domain-containing protein [Dehalococcoidia bacterium]
MIVEQPLGNNHKERLLAVGKVGAAGKCLAALGYRVTRMTGPKAVAAVQRGRFELALLASDSTSLIEELYRYDPTLGFLLLQEPSVSQEQGLPNGSIHSTVSLPLHPGDIEQATQDLLALRLLVRDSKRINALLPLLETGKALLSEVQLGRLFQLIVKIVMEETQADRVSLMLLEGEELVIAAAVGLPEGLAKPIRIKIGEGIAGWVAKTEKALLLPPERGSRSHLRQLLRREEISSALCLPLIAGNRVIGVLSSTKTYQSPPFSQWDLELLSTLCGQAAIAIQNARLFAQVKEEKQRSENLLRQIIWAQEEERRHISLEIHDGAAQWVVGASYHAQAALAALPKNPLLAREHLEATYLVLNRTIKELRLLVGGLHGPDPEGSGLLDTLRDMIVSLETKANLKCKVEIQCQEEVLFPEARIAIYRIAQETLRNVQKHARASRLEFLLYRKGDEVIMT